MEHKDQGRTSIGLHANIAALLSYLFGFVSGIVFLLIEKENRFVRFHAIQSIVVFGFLFVLSLVAGRIPSISYILSGFIRFLSILLWVFLMIKAYQGEYFKLVIAGDIAEKHS